jgi:micrococcal nuclease
VVDGDTIRVRAFRPIARFYTVRLIGIDTPETRRPGRPIECGGPDAAASMKRLAPNGRAVTLRTDPTQATYDRYRRLLAYVSTSAGTLQLFQLNAGWAKVYKFGRAFQRIASFYAAEARARAADRGVWALCGGNFHQPIGP